MSSMEIRPLKGLTMSEVDLCKKHGLYLAAGVEGCPTCREQRSKDFLGSLEKRVAALEEKTSDLQREEKTDG